MYCKRCGKFISDDVSDFCEECKIAVYEKINAENAEKEQREGGERNVGSTMTGFGGALVSAILGLVTCVTVYFCFIFGVLSMVGAYGTVTIVLWGITIALSVVSLVLGIRGVKTFITEKKAGRKKPVATLVLGISGVSISADILLICSFLFLIVLVNAITVG